VTRLNSFTWHVQFIRVTRRIHRSNGIHSGTWRALFIGETWNVICVIRLVHMCDITHSYVYVWHNSLTVTRFHSRTWNEYVYMLLLYVWHDWFTYETRVMSRRDSLTLKTCLVYACYYFMYDMTGLHMRHESCLDATHWRVRHDSFLHAITLCVTWLVYIWDTSHV